MPVSEHFFIKERFPLYEILLVGVGLALTATFYLYLYAKQYDFIIEAPCDATAQECYVRDCSEGDCPPNELSEYRVYSIPAALFSSCTDNSCVNICLGQQSSSCEEILCSSQGDYECTAPRVPEASAP